MRGLVSPAGRGKGCPGPSAELVQAPAPLVRVKLRSLRFPRMGVACKGAWARWAGDLSSNFL